MKKHPHELEEKVKEFLHMPDSEKINVIISSMGKLIKQMKDLEERIDFLEKSAGYHDEDEL